MNVYSVGRSDRMRLRTKTSIQYFVKTLKSHNLPYSQLSNNLIRELPVGSFLSSQTSTTDIVLSNNLITTLEAGVLDPLSSLQTMYALHKCSLHIHTNLEIARVILYIIYWKHPYQHA